MLTGKAMGAGGTGSLGVGSWLSASSTFFGNSAVLMGLSGQNADGDTVINGAWESGGFNTNPPFEGLTFITRDKDGTKLLQMEIDVSSYSSSSSLNKYCRAGIDDSRNVYVAFFDSTVTGSPTQAALIIIKLNSSGVIQWQKSYPQVGPTTCMAVSGAGDLYLCGSIASTSSTTSFRPMMCKINSSGTFQWQRIVSSSNTSTAEIGKYIKIAPNGNIYMSTDFGNSGGNLYQFSPSGAIQGGGISLDDGNNQPAAFAIDSDDNIYTMQKRLISTQPTPNGTIRSQVMKINSSGVVQESWNCTTAQRFEGPNKDIAINEKTGHLAIVGLALNVNNSRTEVCFAELDLSTGTANFAFNFRGQGLAERSGLPNYVFDGILNGVTVFNSQDDTYQIAVSVQGSNFTGGQYTMQIDPLKLPIDGTYGFVGTPSFNTGPMVTVDTFAYAWQTSSNAVATMSRTSSTRTIGTPTNTSFTVVAVTSVTETYNTIS